jgi:hypothetical protein
VEDHCGRVKRWRAGDHLQRWVASALLKANGKIHEIMRTADNKSAAKTRLAQLEAEILEKGTARFEAGKVTFRQLAEYVKTRFYVPASYSEDGSKISGVRSVRGACQMGTLAVAWANPTADYHSYSFHRSSFRSIRTMSLASRSSRIRVAHQVGYGCFTKSSVIRCV